MKRLTWTKYTLKILKHHLFALNFSVFPTVINENQRLYITPLTVITVKPKKQCTGIREADRPDTLIPQLKRRDLVEVRQRVEADRERRQLLTERDRLTLRVVRANTGPALLTVSLSL